MRILIAAITIIFGAINMGIATLFFLDGDIGKATFFAVVAFMLAYLGREIEKGAE